MPRTSAPSPAYVAALLPFEPHSKNMRQARLSARQHAALQHLKVPVVLTSPSPLTPCQQAEDAIRTAVQAILPRHVVSADLYRDDDTGDVSVAYGGTFLTIADIALGLPRQEVRAA